MKRIILVKFSNDIQAAHLYEHLYSSAIYKLFRKNGLFDYIDYWLTCKTYDAGVIYIDIRLYSAEAMKFDRKFFTELIPSLDSNSVGIEMAQIMAEEGYRLDGDADKLNTMLSALHNTPWKDLDDIEYYKADPAAEARGSSIWLSDLHIPISTLRSELILAKEYAQLNPVLLPLHYIVAVILQINFAYDLANACGYYRSDNSSTYSNKVSKYVQKFSVYRDDLVDLEEDLELCKKALQDLIRNNVIDRISEFLRVATYKADASAPDELEVLKDIKTMVGGAGWRKIGTPENVRSLLEHTTLRLAYGGEHTSFALRELM